MYSIYRFITDLCTMHCQTMRWEKTNQYASSQTEKSWSRTKLHDRWRCKRSLLHWKDQTILFCKCCRCFRNSGWTISYNGAVPNFICPKALTTSPGEIAWGQGSVAKFWRAWCHPSHTLRLKALFAGALATRTRWDATLYAETGGLGDWGGRWAAPSWQRRAQLFWVEWLKFILAVDSSHLAHLAASKDSIRWSAISGSPDFSYLSSNVWASSSMQGTYIVRTPLG